MANHKKIYMLVQRGYQNNEDLELNEAEAKTILGLAKGGSYKIISEEIPCEYGLVKKSMEFLRKIPGGFTQGGVVGRAFVLQILVIEDGNICLNKKFMVNPPPAASPQNETSEE